MTQSKTLLDYFSDEDMDKILSYITEHTEQYYIEEEATTHPSSLFVYGIRNGEIDGQIFYIGSVENSNEYFEELGYQIGKVLDNYLVPFLVVLSVEAWLYIQNVESNEETKAEGISVAALTVDGRAAACHQLIERNENNLIKIVKTERYTESSPGYLESFYDGLRNYYTEKLDMEENV